MAGKLHYYKENGGAAELSMFWLNPPAWGETIRLVALASPVLALVTSLVQGGVWVIATAIELLLGALIVVFMFPIPACNGLLLLSPIPLTMIFGALWGFWYL